MFLLGQSSLTDLLKDKDAISFLIHPLLPQALIVKSYTINCTPWFSFCSVTVFLNIIWLSSLCKLIQGFHQVWFSQHSVFYFGYFLSWLYSCFLCLTMSHMVAAPWLGMMGSDQSLGLGGHHFGVLQYFSGEGRNLRLVKCTQPPIPRSLPPTYALWVMRFSWV